MYNLQDIKSIHLEITTKCQAKCPMCPRRIQGGMLMPLFDLCEISLEQFIDWVPVKVITNLDSLLLCGNLGDPLIAKDTLEIIKYSKKINPELNITLHTNGSARNTDWWKDLALTNTKVIFGIDGLEDTHSLYRVSTDFHKIIENASAFIKSGGSAVWEMLVFEHNQHQIDKCKTLSELIGFSKFSIKHTTRFKSDELNVLDETGKTIHVIRPSKKSKELREQIISSENPNNKTIKCKVKEQKSLYIGANGNVSPCCWLDLEWRFPNDPGRMDYMNKIGNFPNLNKSKLEKIFESNHFTEIEKTWNVHPLTECNRQCGTFDRFTVQWDNKNGN